MARVYEVDQPDQYVMDYRNPHKELESLRREMEVVNSALAVLVEACALPNVEYNGGKMLALRAAVRDNFDIPWTAITPRMQRLIYAINAIKKPRVMVAVGIFCGFTFISNAGAAIGPGAVYEAKRLVGIEIGPEEANRARRNIAVIDHAGSAEIIAADGVPWLRDFDDTIDLLYLDADGRGGKGKSIYLDMVEAARHRLRRGSLVLAHNSVNSVRALSGYLEYVRNSANFCESVNVIIDGEGLEVSVR